MKKQIQKVLVPSGFGIAIVTLIGLGLATLFNAGKILTSYGYGSSVDEVHKQVGSGVIGFLTRIDDFRFTTSAVSFLIWAIVGLIILLGISSLIRSVDKVREDLDFVGPSYVKPAAFKKDRFIHNQVISSTLLVVGFVLLVIILIVLIRNSWPHANSLIRQLNSSRPVWQRVVKALLGCAIYIASTGIVLYTGHLIIRRNAFLSD